MHRNKLSPGPVDRTRIEVNVYVEVNVSDKRWMCEKTMRVGRTGKEVLSDMSFLLVYSTDLLPSWHKHCSFREKMDRRHGFIYTLNSYPITHKHKILPRAQPSPALALHHNHISTCFTFNYRPTRWKNNIIIVWATT